MAALGLGALASVVPLVAQDQLSKRTCENCGVADSDIKLFGTLITNLRYDTDVKAVMLIVDGAIRVAGSSPNAEQVKTFVQGIPGIASKDLVDRLIELIQQEGKCITGFLKNPPNCTPVADTTGNTGKPPGPQGDCATCGLTPADANKQAKLLAAVGYGNDVRGLMTIVQIMSGLLGSDASVDEINGYIAAKTNEKDTGKSASSIRKIMSSKGSCITNAVKKGTICNTADSTND
ncbi:hypothetical protein IWQ56_002205 [Coemansia nantahalensis]|nr:hypothetical protein IWQ56_002205 [Coemansia nantahalensis]